MACTANLNYQLFTRRAILSKSIGVQVVGHVLKTFPLFEGTVS